MDAVGDGGTPTTGDAVAVATAKNKRLGTEVKVKKIKTFIIFEYFAEFCQL